VGLELSTLGVVYGTGEEVGILAYADGTPVGAGWPIAFAQHEQILGAGDLAGDGVDEIVVNDDAGAIQVRRADASLLFEIRSRHTHVDLATIADIDPTHPGNELFVLIDDDGDAGGEGDEFALYDARGRRLRVFEAPHGGANPAVGDVLPGMPGLEIAFGLEGTGWVGLLTGTLRPLFLAPVAGVGGGQVALADLFGDGDLEILADTGEAPEAGFVVLDARGHVLARELGKGWDFDPSARLANAAPGTKQFVDVTGDGVADLHASRVGADSRDGHEVVYLLSRPAPR